MNGIHYANCELCGKKDYAEKLLLLCGFFKYLCPDCREKADKTIERFTAYLREMSFAEVVHYLMLGDKK